MSNTRFELYNLLENAIEFSEKTKFDLSDLINKIKLNNSVELESFLNKEKELLDNNKIFKVKIRKPFQSRFAFSDNGEEYFCPLSNYIGS